MEKCVEKLVEKLVENCYTKGNGLNFYGGNKRMTTFYKQTDDGKYVEADSDVDELFRQKSNDIISSKLAKAREKETAKIREEIEEEVRNNALETIKSEAKQELETEYKDKLESSEAKIKELDAKLRRKTIAAEYGFKPEAESFLGNGDDEDMRAKADILKKSFGSGSGVSMEKESESKVSKLQQKTGITVEI